MTTEIEARSDDQNVESDLLLVSAALGQIREVAALSLMFPQGHKRLLPLLRVAIQLQGNVPPIAFLGSWPEILGLLNYMSDDMASQTDRLLELRNAGLLQFSDEDAKVSIEFIRSIFANLTRIEEFSKSILDRKIASVDPVQD